MIIKSSGKIVYESDNLHKIFYVKNLLEYSRDYSESVGKNSFWYLDTVNGDNVNTNLGFNARHNLTRAVNDDGTGGAKLVNTVIPPNRYSFFENLDNKPLPPMSLTFEITLNNDPEIILSSAGANPGKVVITKFYLWVPKMIPKDSLYSEFMRNFLKPTKWTYMRDLYNESSVTQAISIIFQISPAITNVKHVFIYLQRENGPNDEEDERNPYIYDTWKLNAADVRLEYGNSNFTPEHHYTSDSKIRIFNDLMQYSYRKNDYSGTQLNISNYSSFYGLIYFDLTYQKETVTRDSKMLTLHYKLNVAPAAGVKCHSIVFYESEIIVDKIGNKLMTL